MDGRINFLKGQILKNLQKRWTIEQMATAVELSPSHLQKIFKSEIGMPPITFLRELRLVKARELLESKFWRVKQIRIETGLANDSHFTRDFKKKFGLTPTAYRIRYWAESQANGSSGQKS